MADDTPATVFITKYALTDGVRECQVVKLDPDGYAYVRMKGAPTYGMMMGRKDWHRTAEAAVERANEMRRAKMASHEQAITKLRRMTFPIKSWTP